MSRRQRNHGLRKVCGCRRANWAKCPHAWYINYTWRGELHRFSLDRELWRHIDNKTEAEHEADRIRLEIRAGAFRRRRDPPLAGPTPSADSAVTLDTFAPLYIERMAKASGKRSWKDEQSRLNCLREYRTTDGRRFGEQALSAITEDAIETFHSSLVTLAASTRNKYVQLLKSAFRWAAKKGYLERSPISEDTALKRATVAQRRRRLTADEEKTLLDAAGALTRGAGLRLQWLIIAAIETGCRFGELLALHWADVNVEKRTLLVRAVEEGAKKTGRSRLLPMSARLAAVLEMARFDPAARRYSPMAYVFGRLGARVRSVKKAWETCVLKAHGHYPEWRRRALSPASREKLRAIDLHFHDLRHEAGCRWLEAGWPIHHVQEMLGHANLSQTSTYLHAAEMGLQESMKKFDAARIGKPQAKETSIEHRPFGHDETKDPPKGLLH